MEDNKLLTPKKKKKRLCHITEPDEFDLDAIRNHIYGYYLRGELPTCQKLLSSLKAAELFKGGATSLRIVLKKCGYVDMGADQRYTVVFDTKMDIKQTIIETHRDGIQIVQYNKPNKKNAIDSNMYQRVISILSNAASDDSISVIVLTGTGDFYSSGNDFSVPIEERSGNLTNILKEYINAFITFPKLLVAIVNGPAIGIAATTLALCDLVFASENSYFYTPFTKLGIVAEGCSTFTFPRLIGDRKAAEMLLCSHRMSAKEALDCGFINYIYKPDDIQSEVWNKIEKLTKLPKHSVSVTKKLMRDAVRRELLETNDKEMKELDKIWAMGRFAFKSKV